MNGLREGTSFEMFTHDATQIIVFIHLTKPMKQFSQTGAARAGYLYRYIASVRAGGLHSTVRDPVATLTELSAGDSPTTIRVRQMRQVATAWK